MNTWFKLPPRRLYTWSAPGHSSSRIIKNQIDFILINKRYRNAVKAVKAYPEADVGSDHNPVVAKIRIRWKQINSRPNQMKGPRFELISQAQRKAVNLELENVSQSAAVFSIIDDNWQLTINILLNTKNRLTNNTLTPKSAG